jgi:hypothetical protein
VRSLDSFIPSTFEDRGIALSFTTPQLAYCRVRKDYRSRLEVTLPNIGSSRGNYVIPWSGLAEAMSLTVYDRALQEEVERMKALSPSDIRVAELIVAREGLAGPEAAESAAKSLADDEEQVTLTNLMFMAKVIMASNGMTPEMVAGIASGKSDQMVRTAAYQAAQAIGVKPTQLDHQLGRLARIVGPLGIEGAPEAGRLRRLVNDLEGFRDSLEPWAEEHPHGEVEVAGFCAEVSGLTLERANIAIGQFDAHVRDPLNVLQRWDEEIEKLQSLVTRLSWLLDGWELLIRIWDAAANLRRENQDSALLTIFRALPLLPKSEYDEFDGKRASTLRVSTKRSVRMYEDWNTGELDYDLVARIEAAKARRT